MPLTPQPVPAPTRAFCLDCLKARSTCLCESMRRFDAGPLIVVLMHPRERRTRSGTGTGRIAHLCISNSRLVEGLDFDGDPRLGPLLSSPALFPCVLFPGPQSFDLSRRPEEFARQEPLAAGRRPVVFVVDGTWANARAILRRNAWLRALPGVTFTPERPSMFRFKTQPHRDCMSTIEAIHALLDRFNAMGLWRTSPDGAHDALLEVFNTMVERQLAYAPRRSED